jgi:glycosyltransferase involved in cell wall biosynthesis
MNSDIKVLFISSWYPCRVTPTNGNFIQRHAEAVAQYCSTASLFVTSDRQVKNGFEISENIINGVYTIIVYYPKTNNSIFSLFKKYSSYKKAMLYGYKKIETVFGKPDVLHGNVIIPAGFMVRKLSKKINVPYILTEHWTGFLKSRQHELTFWQKQLAKYATATAKFICPVSYSLQQSMQAIGIKGNYKVIANVVNENIFLLKEEKITKEKIHFLHISNLNDAHKNISGLIKAIKILSENTQNFHITILGDGNPTPFQELANKIGIPKHLINIEGEKTLEEIAQLFQNADAFVLFSNYENLPCVISEAHMVGIPVISTNVGGINEMINELNGVMIEPGDTQLLANAMNSFIRIEKKYNALEIREKALDKYGLKQVGKQYYSLYKQIIEG